MMRLVDDFNAGGFARDSLHSAPIKFDPAHDDRSGWRGRDIPVEGVPHLPQQWAQFLITAPFDAHVVSVQGSASRNVAGGVDITPAHLVLDKGKADGLHIGMKIRIGGWSPDSGWLTINSVDEHKAEGAFEAFTLPSRPAQLPSVGQAIRIGEPVTAIGSNAE